MIVINIEKDGIDLFKTILDEYPQNIDIDEVEYSFDGSGFFQIFLEITEFTLPIIASILITKEGKSKVITVKNGGKEIIAPIKEELTLEEVKALLEKCKEDEE